jgi:predicted transcriptional regulator
MPISKTQHALLTLLGSAPNDTHKIETLRAFAAMLPNPQGFHFAIQYLRGVGLITSNDSGRRYRITSLGYNVLQNVGGFAIG